MQNGLSEDGQPMVDFVLVYETYYESEAVPYAHRNANDKDLIEELVDALSEQGLDSVTEVVDKISVGDTPAMPRRRQIHFIKITASDDFLDEMAELLRIRVPIKIMDIASRKRMSFLSPFFRFIRGGRDDSYDRFSDSYFYRVRFLRRLEDMYYMESKNGSFFTETQRIYLVWRGLESVSFQTTNAPRSDIKIVTFHDLLEYAVLTAAYPPHDSQYEPKGNLSMEQLDKSNQQRAFLHGTWAKFSQWRSQQPLDNINHYFGSRTAIYFAFLGSYTKLLFFPAILGLIVTVAGIVYAFEDSTVKDICSGSASNYTTCPVCDPRRYTNHTCWTEKLRESCDQVRISTIMDNPFTLAYGFLISLWCVAFMEFWKRREAELSCRWGTGSTEVRDFHVRSEFIHKYKDDKRKLKYSMSTLVSKYNDFNTAIRIWSLTAVNKSHYYSRIAVSTSLIIVFMMLALVFAAVSTFLRIVVRTNLADKIGKIGVLSRSSLVSPSLLASLFISTISAMVMLILSAIYTLIAEKLNKFECLRTEEEFQKSCIYKCFAFQFVNFFSGLFYTAFIKHFIGSTFMIPEVCPTDGCISEICIQLLITLSIKQLYNNFWELSSHKIIRWVKELFGYGKGLTVSKLGASGKTLKPHCTKDYNLTPMENPALCSEYLELSIQYAFVTLFATICPPAAVLALLNNIIEIRIDASKMTRFYRRPVPLPAKNIGPWFSVFQFITKAAIFTNACLIAFGGSFIDRVVYKYRFANATKTYVDFIYRNVSTFDLLHLLSGENVNGSMDAMEREVNLIGPVCYVRDYRELKIRANSDLEYYWHTNLEWWTLFAIKFVFVVMFEKILGAFHALIAGLIPDVPSYVKLRHEREAFLEQEALMEANRQDNAERKASLVMTEAMTSQVVDDTVQTKSRRTSNWDEVEYGKWVRRDMTSNDGTLRTSRRMPPRRKESVGMVAGSLKRKAFVRL